MRWIFLPGLDGTGLLLEPVLASVPSEVRSTLIRYPVELKGGYNDYVEFAARAVPPDEPCVLIAESFSGPVAVKLASAFDNIKAMVLAGSFVSSPRATALRHLLPLLRIGLSINRTSSFMIRRLLAGKDAPVDLVRTVAKAGRAVPSAVLAHRVEVVLTCDERGLFAKLKIPTLAHIAEEDRLVPPSYSNTLKGILPSLAVRYFKCAHLILELRTNEAIRSIAALA